MKRDTQVVKVFGFGALLMATTACAGIQGHERELAVDPVEMEAYLSDKPVETHGMYASVLRQGERNLVLNHMRSGLAAMELGHDQIAAQSFDAALDAIEKIYADNPEAAAARSTFVKENRKDFKGEPYERAMAYYYRGLIYLREGDYENARASFRGGMLQDTLASEETYSQDFALLAFLDGWASKCNGDAELARQSFAEARALRGDLREPPADHNLLVLAETGMGPVKIGAGEHSEKLTFQRREGFGESTARADVGSSGVPMALAEDIYWQASTRGGREVDYILEGKANFKDNAEAAGETLATAGVATSALGLMGGGMDLSLAGGFMALAGIGAQMASAAATPEADTRYWDNLPDSVHLATGQAAASSQQVRVTFLDDGMSEIPELERSVEKRTAGGCSIAWARSRSAVDVPERAPNSGVAIANAQ